MQNIQNLLPCVVTIAEDLTAELHYPLHYKHSVLHKKEKTCALYRVVCLLTADMSEDDIFIFLWVHRYIVRCTHIFILYLL